MTVGVIRSGYPERKLLLQTVWGKDLNWDDELDSTDTSKWMEIKEDLMKIGDVVISRCVSIPDPRSETKYEIVCFCDASAKAYATSVYLVQKTDNSAKSDLIFSKTRIAPLKGMSIPRLELLAVLIGVRGVKFVETQIKLPLDSIVLMSDSQCDTLWISSKNKLQHI